MHSIRLPERAGLIDDLGVIAGGNLPQAVQQVPQACDFDAQLARFGFQDALIGLALSGDCLTERAGPGLSVRRPARQTMVRQRGVALSVDGRTPTMVQSYAVTDKLLRVDLSPDGQIVSMFRQGNRLTLISNDARYEFNLTNTSQLIPVFAKCVGDVLNPAAIAAHPSNPAPITAGRSGAPAPTIEVENRRAEAVSIVANVLGASGLTGFRILDETNDQDHDHVAWTAEHIGGSLTITDQANVDTVIGGLIGSEAAGCSGKFASGKLPSDQNGERHAFVLCEELKNSTNTFYLVVPRGKGGNYVFAVTGSQEEASKMDTELKPLIQHAVFVH